MNRAIAALSLFAAFSSADARAAWPADHLSQASTWLSEITPQKNDYGSPSEVWYDANGKLNVYARCGGFVAELIKQTYSSVTDDVLEDLTGSPSPNATQLYTAIDGEASVTTDDGAIAFVARDTIDDVVAGDILASDYETTTSTGHVMMVATTPVMTGEDLATAIPDVDSVDRYTVHIIDATSSVHGNSAGTTDTRYLTDRNSKGLSVNDKGLGAGDILIYADHATGEIVGWTWNTYQSTPYQGTDPDGTDYRPIVAGALQGAGL